MTAMRTHTNKVFGAGLAIAALFLSAAAMAQNEVDEIGPAVDTSAVEAAVDEPKEVEAETGPAANTAARSDDIERNTSGSRVMDSIELGRTEITGNQELPKVLYIVPWKKADPSDLMGRPVNTLLDEVLAPIDREEFIRQVDYYHDLYGDEEE
jgi:hypothetical protein